MTFLLLRLEMIAPLPPLFDILEHQHDGILHLAPELLGICEQIVHDRKLFTRVPLPDPV